MSLLDKIAEKFNVDALASSIAELLPNLVMAALTIFAYWLLWRLIAFIIRRFARRRSSDQTTLAFVHTGLKTTLMTLGLISALGQLGVDTASLLASLGIVGLTIGFAARDALSNIISGILIFWDRPFVLGDLIEVSGFYGRVERITLRSTRVVTPDGKMLAIPNSTIIGTPVASYTNFPHIRVTVDVSVGTSSDLGRVRALLLQLVAHDPAYMTEPAPSVGIATLGDYAINMQLLAWLHDEKSHIDKRCELRERVFEALRADGVEMPCERFSLEPIEFRRDAA